MQVRFTTNKRMHYVTNIEEESAFAYSFFEQYFDLQIGNFIICYSNFLEKITNFAAQIGLGPNCNAWLPLPTTTTETNN